MASQRLTTFIEILMIRAFQSILEIIAIKLLKNENLHAKIEAIFMDTNIRIKSWSFWFTYNPNKPIIDNFRYFWRPLVKGISDSWLCDICNGDGFETSLTCCSALFKLCNNDLNPYHVNQKKLEILTVINSDTFSKHL